MKKKIVKTPIVADRKWFSASRNGEIKYVLFKPMSIVDNT